METGQVNGKQYAVPMSINVKSIVYYPKKAAADAGLTSPPQTLDDLMALSQKIAATGTTPWCFGIESGAATGWPATDWVENLMLINNGSDVYNQWVKHEIPFNDPKVADAGPDGQAAARRRDDQRRPKSIASNNFNTAANPMFDNPRAATCTGRATSSPRRAASRTRSSPISTTPWVSSRCPARRPEDKPVLGGGDLAGIFSKDNESAKKLVEFLASKDSGTNGYREAGAGSPRGPTSTRAGYPSQVQDSRKIAYESTEFVFDGSDQMPGEVGSGSFWKEMTAWISGQEDAKTALDNIEASWPSLTGGRGAGRSAVRHPAASRSTRTDGRLP